MSPREVVQAKLVIMLQKRSDLLAEGENVPAEVEHEIEELNKDLEFIDSVSPS